MQRSRPGLQTMLTDSWDPSVRNLIHTKPVFSSSLTSSSISVKCTRSWGATRGGDRSHVEAGWRPRQHPRCPPRSSRVLARTGTASISFSDLARTALVAASPVCWSSAALPPVERREPSSSPPRLAYGKQPCGPTKPACSHACVTTSCVRLHAEQQHMPSCISAFYPPTCRCLYRIEERNLPRGERLEVEDAYYMWANKSVRAVNYFVCDFIFL
jgi:hypothetical protein